VNVEELVSGSRTILRDFPQYFEVDEGPLNVLTIRLPHPMISGKTVQVYATDDSLNPPLTNLTTNWQLDERIGLLKITDEGLLNKRLLVTGYHFNWFADTDLSFHVGQVMDEMVYGQAGGTAANYEPAQWDLIMLGGVVHALHSLAMELSLDIDVSTPEGMFIPARQRFAQTMQMVQYYEGQYESKAAMLNMGLNSLEQYRLRRVALMTGRYVPVYRDREFDDPRPPERLYPAIPYGVPTPPEITIFDRPPAIVSGPPAQPPVIVADEVAVQDSEPTNPSIVLWVDTDEP
jgi:hypothetical protein